MAPTIDELEIEMDELKDTIGEIKTLLARLEEKIDWFSNTIKSYNEH